MILDYLRKNPNAADTLEGIAQWWLEQERIEIGADHQHTNINIYKQ